MVGDVLCATTDSGDSWKLSGGRALSAGVTKASKKRHVRLAINRNDRASVSANGRRPNTRGERLAQNATAGEANQASANAEARGQVLWPQIQATLIAAAAVSTAPPIRL